MDRKDWAKVPAHFKGFTALVLTLLISASVVYALVFLGTDVEFYLGSLIFVVSLVLSVLILRQAFPGFWTPSKSKATKKQEMISGVLIMLSILIGIVYLMMSK